MSTANVSSWCGELNQFMNFRIWMQHTNQWNDDHVTFSNLIHQKTLSSQNHSKAIEKNANWNENSLILHVNSTSLEKSHDECRAFANKSNGIKLTHRFGPGPRLYKVRASHWCAFFLKEKSLNSRKKCQMHRTTVKKAPNRIIRSDEKKE